jgi:O-antigen ligase
MIVQSKDKRWQALPLLALVCLGISILGCEWSWATVQPLVLSWLLQAIPVIGLLILATGYGAFVLFRLSGHSRRRIYFCLGLYVLVLSCGVLGWFSSPPTPWIYVFLMQAIVGGFVGYRIGETSEAAEWTLQTLARVAAAVSIYKFVTPDVETGSPFPSLGVGWPIGVYILFGLCWYVYAALSARRLSIEIVFGTLACALEVFVSFRKPIVVAGIGSMVTMVLMVQFIGPTRLRTNFRLVCGIVMLVATLAAALSFTGDSLIETYREQFYTKYLHMSAAGGNIGLDEKTATEFSGGRFDLWEQGVDRFLESPWVGSGPGQQFFDYKSSESVHAHNAYLELLYSIGIIGALAHLLGAWVWFREVIMTAGLARRASVVAPIAAYLGGFLAFESGEGALALHSLLLFVSLLLGIALGYSVQDSADIAAASPRHPMPHCLGINEHAC